MSKISLLLEVRLGQEFKHPILWTILVIRCKFIARPLRRVLKKFQPKLQKVKMTFVLNIA